MSRILTNIQLTLDEELEEKLAWLAPGYSTYRIHKKSVDARRRLKAPHFNYTVEVFGEGEAPVNQMPPLEKISRSVPPALIIGAGPAGLFAALRLAERGIPAHIFEQGGNTGERIRAISRFWRYGELNVRSNVGFGEGGAGLFSDGKLITRIKSSHIPYVMDRLVQFGAPDEIRYLANPHVGSDRIRRIIPRIREFLETQGCVFHLNKKVTRLLVAGSSVEGLETETGEVFRSAQVILACGHSAEDFFKHLNELGVHMEGKSFAVGLRIEHPQILINQLQYREWHKHPKLETANYKLAFTNPKNQVGVYSFCMCPGGYVLSSGTEAEGVVANGMSNYNRGSAFANAAIVVSVDYKKTFGDKIFSGLEWRRQLEHEAWKLVQAAGGSRELPAQRVVDFLGRREGPVGKSSSPSGVRSTRLDSLFARDMNEALEKGLGEFEKWMPGFVCDEAIFHGVESRTSCPLRITRDSDTLESLSHRGLYPIGEGAGYAGGITSAACDGVKVADKIYAGLCSQQGEC